MFKKSNAYGTYVEIENKTGCAIGAPCQGKPYSKVNDSLKQETYAS